MNSKGSLSLAFLVGLLILLSIFYVLYYYFYSDKQLSNPKPDVATVRVTQTLDNTSDWNSYENTPVGFSLKYPRNWVKQDNVIDPLTKAKTRDIVNFFDKDDIRSTYYANESRFSIQDYRRPNIDSGFNIDYYKKDESIEWKEIKVDNRRALIGGSSAVINIGPGEDDMLIINFDKGDLNIEKILWTFKFSN